MPPFVPPPDLVVLETEQWIVNQRVGVSVPGYLVMQARDPSATRIAALSDAAAAEMGPLLRRLHRAIEAELSPRIVYTVKWGHGPGHAVHFHVIPVHAWMEEALLGDERYRALEAFHTTPEWTLDDDYDGTEMCLFVCREYGEGKRRETPAGPTIEDVVRRLRAWLAREGQVMRRSTGSPRDTSG